MDKSNLALNRWWIKARFSTLGSALARGVSRALDRRATAQLLDASLACAALSAALRRAVLMGSSNRSGLGAAWSEIETLRAQATGPEEQFIMDCILHALGDATDLPVLCDNALALHSKVWRQTRRRLRRFGAALRTGAPLGAKEGDLLAEVGALLDRMRQDSWAGVGWPNAGSLARSERDQLNTLLGPIQGKKQTGRRI